MGLTGSGLVIQNNGGGEIVISGSGTFSFATPVTSGNMYNVTAKTQPTNLWWRKIHHAGSCSPGVAM